MDKEKYFKRYLHGEMDRDEFLTFQEKLNSDPVLREEFRIHQAMHKYRADKIKTVLKQNKSSTITAASKVRILPTDSNFRYWISSVAAVVLIGAVAYFLTQKTNLLSSIQVPLSQVYLSEGHVAPPVSMNEENKIDKWSLAIEAYRKEEFEITINQINQIQNPDHEQNLYLGLSYIYQNQPDYKLAEKHFEKMSQNGESRVKDQALWFSSLVSLQLGHNKKAEQKLKTIVNSNSWKHREARQILAEINK